MADLALSLCEVLLSTISTATELWENRSQNEDVREKLQLFMNDLQVNISDLQNKCIGAHCSNSTAVALDALRIDLESAIVEAKTILKEGFIQSLWDANKTAAQLHRLHNRIMTSFQTKLTIATLDVMIETKQGLDSFQDSMLKFKDQLLELYSPNPESVRRIENLLREEWRKALQPVMIELEKSNGGVEDSVIRIRNTRPQTSETEKFLADVLAGLNLVAEHSNSTVSETRDTSAQLQWYQDPVTWETMCDPVKGTDGYTYDRWTFLRHAPSMTCSPLLGDMQTPFLIACDDLSVRSRLFHEFPDQEERCRVERAAYKGEALQAAHDGRFGEALIMLNNVLLWNPQDKECRSKRDYIQQVVANSNTEMSEQATSSSSCAPVVSDRVVHQEQRNDAAEVTSNYEVMEPCYLDECTDAVLSADKLTATYSKPGSRNILHANRPCPSDCYPFYYFEMSVEPPVTSNNNGSKGIDVAIGFSCTKDESESSHPLRLGMYAGSCGYYSLNGEIRYYDKEKNQVVSIFESDAFQAGDTVGAGFHSCTGNVFFTRFGQVVAVVKAAILEHPIFPSAGLQSYGARVRLNFGHSPHHKFLDEPYPSCLDWRTCDENHLVRGETGLSLKTKENRGTFRGILADKPVPVRTSLFYFEVCNEDYRFSADGSIAIGFTGTDGFQQEGSPGYWKNSCGHQSNVGFASLDNRIGAGIHYGSNEIFFVKRGFFVGAVANTLTGKVMPSLAVRSSYKTEVKFGSCLEISKPSGFRLSSRLQTFGLSASQKDILRFKKHGSSRDVVAFQADNVAPFHLEDFYFEITVDNKGKSGNITVGFCHHNHFRDDMQPGGYLHSCGYDGATGKLLTGLETGQYGPTFSQGDAVGAGISFNTNTIFFVKNGKVIESIPNQMMSCALYPVVSLGSVGEVVHFNFGKQPFLFPTKIQI